VKKTLIIFGALLLAVVAIGSACSSDTSEPVAAAPAKEQTAEPKKENKPAKPKPAPAAADEEIEVTAEMTVDFMTAENPGVQREFCKLHNGLGYELGLESFSSGYGEMDEEGMDFPSAPEVYDELVSRC
jgi:hypothetical protein